MENANQFNGESLVEELAANCKRSMPWKLAIMLHDLKPFINASIKPCHLSTVFNF